MRFENKIDFEKSYLAYSGGKDSHLIKWFIDHMGYDITIVGVNTYREHAEIRDRIYENSDIVLYPVKTIDEIKEKNIGIPCFTKNQDEYIDRYQRGSRAKSTLSKFEHTGDGTGKYGVNKKATELTLKNKLHRVSRKCCYWSKELPMMQYGEDNNKKAIIGIRQAESINREKTPSCLADNGNFYPSYDLTDQIVEAIEKENSIYIPKIYKYVPRTGCIGCPYGRNIEKELSIVKKNQRDYAIHSFKESYDVKGINYKDEQMNLFHYE